MSCQNIQKLMNYSMNSGLGIEKHPKRTLWENRSWPERMEIHNPGVGKWPKRTETAKGTQLGSYWKLKNRNSGDDRFTSVHSISWTLSITKYNYFSLL